MLITLHCSGMPFDGNTIKEKSLGGSETAAYYMAKELANKGHKVTLFTNTNIEKIFDGVRYVPMGNATEAYPLGEMFHYYSENTPCDVMIIQRHPLAFKYKWASKINLWWIHDLALYRNKGNVQDMMWNVDGVLTVSEWHKKQVVEVYGLNPDIVYPITNGVDLGLFEGKLETSLQHSYMELSGINTTPEVAENLSEILIGEYFNQIKLLYTSRPERGLEYLVKKDGIMERLWRKDERYHLYVCGYDNITPQMKDYYNMLWERCEDLPNVTSLGALTKQELADVMRQVDLHVYPSKFEETSCITAMECMAAGLPMLGCKVGALPETAKESGIRLLDEVDVNKFVTTICDIPFGNLVALQLAQKEAAKKYSWKNACEKLHEVIQKCFIKCKSSKAATLKQLIHLSDYYAAKDFIKYDLVLVNRIVSNDSSIDKSLMKELSECYAFTKEPVWDKHYEKYYKYEEERGVEYGPEDLSNNHRYMHVCSIISELSENSCVLDYGCAHGHYTVNLAKQFPDKRFVGIDIAASNIEKARRWADEEGLTNVEFYCGRIEEGKIITKEKHSISDNEFDAVIAAEVLEHVADPGMHVEILQNYAKGDALMIFTTPYGPWEAQGFKEHWPWRAHVYHFEREDLTNMFGHNNEFKVSVVPGGVTKEGEVLGSYVTTYENSFNKVGNIDILRKIDNVVPTQTLSVCMIVGDAPNTIRRCLESVMPYADELIVSCDQDYGTETSILIHEYMSSYWPEKSFTMVDAESPLEIGFDEARNRNIEKATGDWILWIDSDEYIHNGHLLSRYLRNNQYNGYAVKQHHFSMKPVGILKTDLPVRIFRNNVGVKFLGKVHEHPEQKLNKGVGFVAVLEEISILHDGYTDEFTRRKRFNRNIGLLEKDRMENPDRILGKFLWIRDLAQSCQWELEGTRGRVTKGMINKAEEGIELWRELLDCGELRLVVDSLTYYSTLSKIKGGGFDMDLKMDTNAYGEADSNSVKSVHAYFNSREDANKLINAVFEERTKNYDGAYM